MRILAAVKETYVRVGCFFIARDSDTVTRVWKTSDCGMYLVPGLPAELGCCVDRVPLWLDDWFSGDGLSGLDDEDSSASIGVGSVTDCTGSVALLSEVSAVSCCCRNSLCCRGD